MWFIEVNVERINTAGVYSPAGTIALNPNLNGKYLRGADTFAYSAPRVNPAAQNPVYAINDDFLVKLFPREFVGKYSNSHVLGAILEKNPNIRQSLASDYARAGIYSQKVAGEVFAHFIPTAKAANAIMKNSGENFSRADYDTMNKAALLHDVGKAYIPDGILNKNGKLNDYERKIVDKHAQLGYEILKTAGVRGPVLNLVKNHHTYSRTNTPMVQILQIADIYSALKEQRPYKAAFSDEQALNILYERAQKGEFDKKYVDALKKSLNA